MSEPYANNREYLSAELAHLNALISREVANWRQLCHRAQPEMFGGMFISEEEIDGLQHQLRHQPTEDVDELREQSAALRREISERRRATLEQGTYLPLAHLAHIFALTPAEEQIVLVCLASEIDQRYEKFFAYLQDDLTRKQPCVNLTLKLVCAEPAERSAARGLFSEQSPLIRSQLVRFLDGVETPLLARGLRLDERIVNFLLETGGLDQELSACFESLPAIPNLQNLRWPEELKAQLHALTQSYLQTLPGGARKLIFNFHGLKGTGRKSLAAALCRELDIALMIVDVREVLRRYTNVDDALRRIFREGVLLPGAIYLEHFESLFEDEARAVANRRNLRRCIEEFSWLTFFGTEQAWESSGLLRGHIYTSVELPSPDIRMRADMWHQLAERNEVKLPPEDWAELAVKFKLTPGQMQDALIAAHNRALLRASDRPVITRDDLNRGCRAQSSQKLGASARKLKPRHTWSDLILPSNEITQLREACAQVRHRQTVYGEWGFDEKLSLSKGLCVLFYGQSGTGKTLAVEIIANELQLDAYKIDLSTVVSKYIGETEKNLSAIFQDAETSNAILFFDEADALFGKRSEVKDAHDRYANIEINYLLQRMEEFEGLVILATNLRKNIDDAFFRRMHFAVEFPFPDEDRRYHIWRQHFPEAAPVAPDIDFNFLASRLNVAGGNIRNIVVNAAFLAADNSGVINMQHLIHAARREYEKIGRLCTEAEFSPYHALLKDR